MSGLGPLIPLWQPWRHMSLRHRLLLLALLPLAVVLPVLLLILAVWGGDYFNRLLVTKVQSDLSVAQSYYERVTDSIGLTVHGMANSQRFLQLIPPHARALPASVLDSAREELGLDFLRFLPVDRANSMAAAWPVLASALEGYSRTETDIFSAHDLREIQPGLAERALTPVIPTRKAEPDTREQETRALMLHSASPVKNTQGIVIGVLEGGVLLNHNLGFIDRLNAIVYPEGALPLGSKGTATLFLGDVRIATNVRLFEDQRAIGTRVSDAVQASVLQQGKVWLDRAFVVNDWYVSGYRPLVDSHQQRIGMLYVGFLEGPFVQAQHLVLGAVFLLFTVAMVPAGIFAALWSRRIFRPIEQMHATISAIEAGQTDTRVGDLGHTDELGDLARHFDRLLDRLSTQTAALQAWGASLDDEVAHRTTALQQALTELKTAQAQLVMSEKLAAIGQLTAGVAHEINNPVAVIQGNLDVLRELLGPNAEPVAPEIKLIQAQIHRIRLIVTKLLQFARPQDYVGYLEPVSPAPLLQDCLLLVGHLLKQGTIAIEQHLDSHRAVLCNRNELQQVIINLLVNAIQAMREGGTLQIGSEDWDEAGMPIGLRLYVQDSGPGINPVDLAQLFKPFFTAHKPDGNGLGLWISQSLIERYDGKITVDSQLGQGSRFTLWLRCEPLAVERSQSESSLV